MTVENINPIQTFIANGSTTTFTFQFGVEDKANIAVKVNRLEISSDEYAYDANSNSIIFQVAPGIDSEVEVRRVTDLERSIQYSTYNNSFRPETLNYDLDRIWRVLQEMGVLNWMVNNDVKDLNAYVDSLNAETKTQFLAEIQKQGISLNQLESFTNQIYQNLADVAVSKGWFAEFVADGEENQKQINDKTIQKVKTIAQLKNYIPRINGQAVTVIDYDDQVLNISNTYIYDQFSTLGDNYGTVIQSSVVSGRWIMQPKSKYFSKDFGCRENYVSLTNDARIVAFLKSGLDLSIGIQTFTFSKFTEVTFTQPLLIEGVSKDLSIFKNVVFKFSTNDSYVLDIAVHPLSENYAFFIFNGSNNEFYRCRGYHCYDGFCIYGIGNTEPLSNNKFIDCESEKACRIGFTVDKDAYRTTVEKCKAIDCRQSIHIEASDTTFLYDFESDGCGSSAAFVPNDTSNISYAGPLRTYAAKNVFVRGFINKNTNGNSEWQHGAGGVQVQGMSSNLNFENMYGMPLLVLDNEAGITTDISFKNIPEFGVFNSNLNQKIKGTLVIENVGQAQAMTMNVINTECTLISLKNVKSTRIQLRSNVDDSVLILDNVQCATGFFNDFKAAHFIIKNGLKNDQIAQTDPVWYHGFYFDFAIVKSFICDFIELIGYVGVRDFTIVNATRWITVGKLEKIRNLYPIEIEINGYRSRDVSRFSDIGLEYSRKKTYYRDLLPTSGSYLVGDEIRKTVISDSILGWVCTEISESGIATWSPLKHG